MLIDFLIFFCQLSQIEAAYPSTVEATFKIIDELKEEGYVFVTVEEILFD